MTAIRITKGGGSVTFDATMLEKLRREIASFPNAHVKVGVLGPRANRTDAGTVHNPTGLNNAEIGLRNEFGVFTERIPERSFLRMPLIKRLPKILNNVSKTDWLMTLVSDGKLKLLSKLGFAGEAAVLDAFATKGFGTWKPNAPLTVILKGSARPLIDHGELRSSISSEVVQ